MFSFEYYVQPGIALDCRRVLPGFMPIIVYGYVLRSSIANNLQNRGRLSAFSRTFALDKGPLSR